ncbi:hypothetical protein [Rickettsia bellii]|uniref:Uncharacterized protein n=1 Tax=Rickettsia bellii str. RML Mogi TaxID=1359194 RepID=A0A0F3QHU2_RICBE|nr:hypothetical protein [Rickettsia bellii]KJV91716.1 hypothetical protein RBEMOGI_0324 [Rickettsia bellii str. RML Mogi]
MKSKFSASILSLNSYTQNPVINEIKKLAEELKVRSAYKIAPTKFSMDETYNQILYALQTVKFAKAHIKEPNLGINETQEWCKKLNDYGIIVTCLLAESVNKSILSFLSFKKGNKILDFLSSYLLDNASEALKETMPKEFIDKYNMTNAVKLLSNEEIKSYLKEYAGSNQQPISACRDTTTAIYEEENVETMGGDVAPAT